jgi:hypothetical protein
MTNFSRQNFAFTIGSDPANESSGVETVDFKVSTNGQVEVYNSFIVSGTVNAGGLSTNGNVVALGPVKLSVVDATLTVKAVAPKYWQITNAAGTTLYIPVYTSLV